MALPCCKRCPPLVVTDLNMPEMDGFALLQALPTLRPGMPTLVVSAYGDPDRMEQARSHGVAGFVVKPVNFAEIRQLMAGAIAEV